MRCPYESEIAYPTESAAHEAAQAREHQLELESFGRLTQPWYPHLCPDGNHWHLAGVPQGPAICPWCRLVRPAWYRGSGPGIGSDRGLWTQVMAPHIGVDGLACPAATLPAARMIPFTEPRPVWILGFDAVMSRCHSGASSSSRELGDLAHKAASRNLALAEQRWSPDLCNQIAEAVRGGIDVRWLVLSRPGVADLRMIAEALPDVVPDIPILTELDMPAQYRLPLRGLAGTDIDPGWESEAVTALVPQDVPLLWIPGFQCACDWEYDCGSDRVDRTTKGVVQRRTGETTVITAKSLDGRITFMTDHDMETIARWVRANEQSVADSWSRGSQF